MNSARAFSVHVVDDGTPDDVVDGGGCTSCRVLEVKPEVVTGVVSFTESDAAGGTNARQQSNKATAATRRDDALAPGSPLMVAFGRLF